MTTNPPFYRIHVYYKTDTRLEKENPAGEPIIFESMVYGRPAFFMHPDHLPTFLELVRKNDLEASELPQLPPAVKEKEDIWKK